jgi:hypothetical protein
MAWLYLPSMEYLSSLESEVLTSALNTSSQTHVPFVMSRGKSLGLKSFIKKCNSDSYTLHPSIPMLLPSHQLLITSLKKWISSLPVSHVNHFPKLEVEREPTTTDGFGIQFLKPLCKLHLPSYSWKTFQTSLMNLGHLMKYQNPFPKSGSILNGLMFERPTLGPIIKETVYSSLLTKQELYQNSILPTPTVSDTIGGILKFDLKPKIPQILTDQLLGPFLFPTPTTNDGHNQTFPKSQSKRNSLVGKIMNLPTPTTSGNQLSPSEMKKGASFDNLKAISNLHGGQGTRLSPLFVEWMMGFPSGWTDLEPSVTP